MTRVAGRGVMWSRRTGVARLAAPGQHGRNIAGGHKVGTQAARLSQVHVHLAYPPQGKHVTTDMMPAT